MRDPLTQLAILYGTDKFGYHDYTPNYFKLLKHLREKPVRTAVRKSATVAAG